MGLMKDAHQDLRATIQFNPNNEEIRMNYVGWEKICKTSCGKEPLKKNGMGSGNEFKNSNVGVERITFDPLKIHNSRTQVAPLLVILTLYLLILLRMFNNTAYKESITKL